MKCITTKVRRAVLHKGHVRLVNAIVLRSIALFLCASSLFSVYADTRILYVAQGSASPAEPYDSPDNAFASVKAAAIYATNLVATAEAVEEDLSVEIRVGAGRYVENPIYVGSNVTLRGDTGNRADIVIGPAKPAGSTAVSRVITAVGIGAVVADLTVTNGYTYADSANAQGGGGAYIGSGATITNCHITRCVAKYGATAAGMRVNGAYAYDVLVDKCEKIRNKAENFENRGFAVLVAGESIVDRCQIVDNTAEGVKAGGNQPFGGALAIHNTSGSPSVVRNCLVARNTILTGQSTSKDYAIGLAIRGGVCENCTIVSNKSDVAGNFYGIIVENGGTTVTEWVRNCHIADNCITDEPTSATAKQYYGRNSTANNLTSRIIYCCMSQKNSKVGSSCVLDVDGTWEFDKKGNFRLLKGSPCIDAASQQTWMAGAIDLYGNDRKLYGKADIGAVEYVKSGGFIVVVR